MAAQTNRLVDRSTVNVPTQVSKDFVKGVTTFVKRMYDTGIIDTK